MKKALILLAACAFSFYTSAQDCNTDFLGTKTLYKRGPQKLTPPPAGYEPVFINHVGRHGARHLTKDVSSSSAYKLLFQADSAHGLTEKGKRLLHMVITLQKIENGNTKSISIEGHDELNGLGERMLINYPGIFKSRPNLKVATTKEIRTKQSADAFLQGLNINIKDTAVVKFYNDDTDLRFYDLSPAYQKFEDGIDNNALTLSLNKEEHLTEMNSAVVSRIFNTDFSKNLKNDTRAKFVSDIFGFATIVYSLNKEIQQAGFTPHELDFGFFFTCSELQKMALLDNADGYLKKGPGINNDGIQVRVAMPLLVDFINTADEQLSKDGYNARLRFAHAETIAPFAALLQISGADKATNKLGTLNVIWKSSEVIPLSSNIQWIFYRDKNKTGYLVKILFNERETHITGLSPASFPYYKWNDLRALYIRKLNKLNVKLTDDMNKYLAAIQ